MHYNLERLFFPFFPFLRLRQVRLTCLLQILQDSSAYIIQPSSSSSPCHPCALPPEKLQGTRSGNRQDEGHSCSGKLTMKATLAVAVLSNEIKATLAVASWAMKLKLLLPLPIQLKKPPLQSFFSFSFFDLLQRTVQESATKLSAVAAVKC